MSWNLFQENSPVLAKLSFEKLNKKIAYLAMIKNDGAPRIHPVTPFIGNGMLFMFTEPTSPKIQDLRRDGRYAMHCSVGGEERLIEVLVSGKAEEIKDEILREQAENIAASPVVLASYVLFQFHINHVLVVKYDKHKKREVQHWELNEE